jgi:hypothetical protein
MEAPIHDPPPTTTPDDSRSSSREQQEQQPETAAAADETVSQSSTSREECTNVDHHVAVDDFVLLNSSATFVPRDGKNKVFLPDIDDEAMSQVQKYMLLYEQDLIWSFVSDGIFLLGGVLYVILSLFDFWTPTSVLALQAFDVLQILAPLVYVLNSFVDIRWTGAARRRIKDKRLLINNLEGWRSYRCCDEENVSSIASSSVDSNSTSAAANKNTLESSIWSSLNRLRKHAAHRRSTLAAFTFGIAATLGFLAVVTDLDDDGRYPPQLARILDKWQNYFYILSASICISGKRTSPWMGYMACDNIPWLSNPDTLEDLGDLLFLIGSIIDTVLTEVPSLDADPIAPLLSSLLWMADSCLYLRGDFIIASNQASPVGGGDNDSILLV